MKMKAFFLALPLLFSVSAFAEKDIEACGMLKRELTLVHGRDDENYAIRTRSGLRFELDPQFLTVEQEKMIWRLEKRLASGRAIQMCVRGYFAGNFRYSGFPTGRFKLSRGAILPAREIESSYQAL